MLKVIWLCRLLDLTCSHFTCNKLNLNRWSGFTVTSELCLWTV